MHSRYGRAFSRWAALLIVVTAALSASDHQALNGTWKLIPARAVFDGELAIQTGAVTISDRQGNIYVSRDFTYTGDRQTVNYSSSTDGRANSSIHEGAGIKTKAKWDGKELKVTAMRDDVITSTERYRLEQDGSLMLLVERPGHRTVTLFFERQ